MSQDTKLIYKNQLYFYILVIIGNYPLKKQIIINLTKHMPFLRAENYKTLMNKIKEDLNREMCHVNGKLNTIKK